MANDKQTHSNQIHGNQVYSDLEYLGRADQYIDEILEITHHIDLFNDFSEEEIRVICYYMGCFAAPRHYTLLEEGKAGEYLLLVLTGTAETKHISVDGNEVLTEVTAGSVLGESAVIAGKPHLVNCTATKPMDFAILTRENLDRILIQAPRLGNKLLLTLLQLLSSRLHEVNSRFLPSLA